MEKEFFNSINELFNNTVRTVNKKLLIESTEHFVLIANRLKKDLRSAPLFKKNSQYDVLQAWQAVKEILFSDNKAKAYMLSRHMCSENLFKIEPTKDNEHLNDYIKDVAIEFVRSVSAASKGRISTHAKKELKNWVNGNIPGRYILSSDVISELSHIDGIRPSTPTVLYRGLLFKSFHLSGERPENALEILRAIKKGHTDFYLTSNRPSSWTKHENIGLRFAKYKAATSNFSATMSFLTRDGAIDGELGVLLKYITEPEDVLVDMNMLNISSNHGDEGEVILKEGKHKVQILRLFNKQGEVDLKTLQNSSGKIAQTIINAVQGLDLSKEHDWSTRYYYGFIFNPEQVEYAYANEQRIKKRYDDIISALRPVLKDFDPKSLDVLEIDVSDAAARQRYEALRSLVDKLLKSKKNNTRLIDSDHHGVITKISVSTLDGNHNRELSRMINSERALSFHLMTENKQKEYLEDFFNKILNAANISVPIEWKHTIKEVNKVFTNTYIIQAISSRIRELIYELNVIGAKSVEPNQ